MARIRGIVKDFKERPGYGFIAPDGGGKDVFVHYTAIEGEGFRTLAKGDAVEFEIVAGAQGKPQAANVTKL